MSPFAEWIEDFEISTETKILKKNEREFKKPEYEDFSVEELGFYIYGKGLDRKELIKWFNKNLLSVRIQFSHF